MEMDKKQRSITVNRLSATEARTKFGKLFKTVHLNKDYIIVEKNGIPVLGIMDATELEDYLDVRNSSIKKQIRKGYEDYKAGKTRTSDEFFAELRSELNEKLNIPK